MEPLFPLLEFSVEREESACARETSRLSEYPQIEQELGEDAPCTVFFYVNWVNITCKIGLLC